ncbi:L-aspartate oxidase [Hydrococcus rivularis NIES-593]|uniref:L-aspartate oxidase n=1 Tax=Hydrococcus rivularis NIES-593 TaxID=1921803 RepID=A0A1U7HED4_9CYAN|nr:L-aspartate oxidase [Hydrococcus rivularis]OKH21901.1 L-aspartate oxidase [Hydrococcus rivularis NIES-593]
MTSFSRYSASSPNLPSQFDVLVVGSGAAGLYAALCLPNHLRVGLVTKDTLKTGASDWAQGGIAAAIDSSDSPKLHLEDTLKAGAGLCDRAAVEFLVEHAASAIQSLLEMGVAFDRQGNRLAMTLEAAHSRPRVLHAADTTGKAIVGTIAARVLERPNIQVISQGVALSLWIDSQTGRCQGISLLYGGQINWIKAAAVILATGGGGQVFAQTTNPAVSTGDGVALAWRAGAVLRDLEFVQFHPTALTIPGAPRFLISEAVRGEGAHLIDDRGRRFAFDYHPAGELAPRDIVSRAIFSHLQKTASDPAQAHVYLDLRPIEPERIRHRFPNIIKVCQQWGIDVFCEPIPVAPAAHYWMGGIATDLMCRTSIARLYAIGETASTGVHGANRLASNSLLECIVFAAQLSQIEVETQPFSEEALSVVTEEGDWEEEIEKITLVRQTLPSLMWQSAGICRSQEVLEAAIAQVNRWRQELANFAIARHILKLSPSDRVILASSLAEQHLRICAETLNLLDIGYLILKSAAFRTESRGGHYRTDYPQTLEDWQVHTLVRGETWQTAPLLNAKESTVGSNK